MKFFLIIILAISSLTGYSQPMMQATIKAGVTPRTIDIYLKSSASFSQKDESMTFTLAIPSNVLPVPSMGSSKVTENTTGAVTGITGLQPNFLINNFGATQREVFVSTESITGTSYYIYTFIFATTATTNHDWIADVEQQIFSIQFNGCTSNCDPINEMLVNLPNGGANGNSYWYFQSNTLGDITNYQNPFYKNAESTDPVNGGSFEGSALSTIALASAVSLPVKINSFEVKADGCNANISWVASLENDLSYYGIERSVNGINFYEIGKINASAPAGIIKEYSFFDNNATSAFSYYRLKIVDNDGKLYFSKIESVKFDCLEKKIISIFPTEGSGVFNIKLSKGLENAAIKVLNSIGQEVIKNVSGNLFRSLNLKQFSNGIYLVQVISNNKIIENVKIVLAH